MAAVLEYLQGRGQTFTVIPHPRAPISQDRVHVARIPRELVVKTVVAFAELAPVMLVVPAARTVDLGLVADAVGDPRTRLATREELERQFPTTRWARSSAVDAVARPTFVDPPC
jgi:prolyl-tRNA editing enzyme YbaK/EbsC (Cys-tRNA(Pro) deacylase)